MRLVRRTLKFAETLVFAVAIVGVIAAIGFFAVPKLMGWQGVIVLTGSMEPELDVGALAFIDPKVNAASIEVGDVITYRDPTGFDRQISHRVIEISRDAGKVTFRTQGDANELADEALVPESVLVGRLVFDVPYVGDASNWLRRRENFYPLLLVPAALIILMELSNIVKDLRKRDLPEQGEATS